MYLPNRLRSPSITEISSDLSDANALQTTQPITGQQQLEQKLGVNEMESERRGERNGLLASEWLVICFVYSIRNGEFGASTSILNGRAEHFNSLAPLRQDTINCTLISTTFSC